MNRTRLLKYLKLLLPLPYIIGLLGYFDLYPGDYSNGFYHVLRLYVFEYDMDDINLFLDISRWTAPAVTTAYLMTGLQSVFFWLSCQWKRTMHKDDVIAIYGDNEKTATFIENLPKGMQVIQENRMDTLQKVKRHVVMFEKQEDNLHFFQKHLKNFEENNQVYLHLEGYSPNLIQDTRLEIFPFSLAKTTAYSYLTQAASALCDQVFQEQTRHLVLIGAGHDAEEILDYCLNFHIFHVKQQIIYHVFGDFDNYASMHFGLPAKYEKDYLELTLYPNDKIRFYYGSWESEIATMESMDQVVLCQETDMENLMILDKIFSFVPMQKISGNLYMKLGSEKMFQLSTEKGKQVFVFGTYSEICSASLILQDELMEKAKQQMNEYATLTKNVMGDLGDWKKLDPHVRDSNLYSAMYRNTSFPLVPRCLGGCTEEERLEFMSELEHIRWNRFHFLRNWQLCPDKLEKAEQRARRLHTDLVHYYELSEETKDWDRKEAAKVLAEYDKNHPKG